MNLHGLFAVPRINDHFNALIEEIRVPRPERNETTIVTIIALKCAKYH
jgi:hypothetical protein